MYVTKAVNGVPAIHRDGQSVLSVCELGDKSELLLNEQDWEWLNAIHRPFRRTAQHA